MRLSEEKIVKLGEEMAALLTSRPDLVAVREDRSRLARDLARVIAADLRVEDEITQEAMAQVDTYSRGVLSGSQEWELLVAKHKEEIAARRGYVL